ncbi:MAG TPA: oligosaccharide flippase family protein [Polyangiaceae bacterium]
MQVSQESTGDVGSVEAGDAVSSQPVNEGELARSAGRGGLAIAFAKIYFMLVGLVQQIVLPRVLGLGGYGALSSALSASSIVSNPVTTTSIQGVSRAVAHATPSTQAGTIRRVFGLHALFGIGLGSAFFGLAPWIGRAFGMSHVVPALRILSAILLLYSLYTPLVGVLNGQRRFSYQAGFDMLATTLRTVGLVVGALLFEHGGGSGIDGASAGFVGGALIVFALAASVVGIGRRGPSALSVKAHLIFIGPILIGQGLLNLLLQADSLLLRRFAADAAIASGLGPAAADTLVGAYRAIQLFSFLPYQLLIAVTFILFPMLAKAARDGDRVAVARYVSTGVRLSCIFGAAIVSVSAGLSERLVELVYGHEAATLGGPCLELLALGFLAFAILGVLTTVLNSLNREIDSAVVVGIAFLLVVVLCFLRVRGGTFGPGLLLATAQATSTGLVLATLSAAFLVQRAAGAVVPLRVVLRVLFALSVAVAVGRYLPHASKLVTPVYAGVVVVVYALVLVVTRELDRADLETARAVLGKRRARRAA